MQFEPARWSRLQAWVQTRLARRTPSENTFLFLLPVTGFFVGVLSVLIAHTIAFVQNRFWGSGTYLLEAVTNNPWPALIIIPLAGGLVVGVIGWAFKVETRGAGTAGLIQALSLRGGFVSLGQTIPRVIAAIFTLACGGSLGREGPMTQLAGALGSHLGRRFKLTPQQLRTLVCAAAASALAAVYNAPIGGSIFALEILMGNFALEVFGPVVVASVISTLVFRSAMGDLPRFLIPHYELVSAWELGGYLVLGILGGIISVVFVRVLYLGEDAFAKIPGPGWLKPVIGFAVLGALGIVTPHVFGNGYETVNLALHQDAQLTLKLLLILPLAKMLATALTYGAGGAGGLFMPSLVVGGLLGAAFGHGVHGWFPDHTAEPGAYALVGMGAIVAGTTHAPLTAIMMIFEQTNSYQIVLPLMFVCIISHVTAKALRGQSLHEEALRRRGIKLPQGPEGSVMQTLRVADIMHDDLPSVNHSAPFPAVVERFLREPYNNLYVIDGEGKFLGAIRLHSLKGLLNQTDTLQGVVAHDLLDDEFEFVTPEEKLADTMDKFWRQNSERLPVINNPTDRRLIGWISKRDLIGVYSQEILRKRQLLGRFVVNDGDEKHEVFVELPAGFEIRTIELPVHCAGKTLAQLAPRSGFGVHVLAYKHRQEMTGQDLVEMPGPQTTFVGGDRLVVIGKFEAIAAFMAALATGESN
jgi:CIC family chloride channel protein